MIRINSKYLITSLIVFITVTGIVLFSDSTVKKVRFRNQDFQIHQENASITNTDIELNIHKSNIQNQEIETNSKNINITNEDTNIQNKDTDIELSDMKFENRAFVDNQNTDFETQKNTAQNVDTRMQNLATAIKNKKFEEYKQEQERQRRYKYQNISWNVWKSNFINKFLDDSLMIKSLDTYGIGTWFYYSFIVTKDGEIKDIKVKSFYLKEEDKNKIRDLIRSYAHKDITIFPFNSQRESAKVDAIVLLGDTETKTKPSDFNDNEKIRIEY